MAFRFTHLLVIFFASQPVRLLSPSARAVTLSVECPLGEPRSDLAPSTVSHTPDVHSHACSPVSIRINQKTRVVLLGCSTLLMSHPLYLACWDLSLVTVLEAKRVGSEESPLCPLRQLLQGRPVPWGVQGGSLGRGTAASTGNGKTSRIGTGGSSMSPSFVGICPCVPRTGTHSSLVDALALTARHL